MEQGGWQFENMATGKHHEWCKGDTWHGHRNNTEMFSAVEATFIGHGIAELKIENCGFDNAGIIKVNLSKKELGSIDKMTERYFTFRFSPNDTLHIIPVSEQQYGAVINIVYLQILCGRNKSKIISILFNIRKSKISLFKIQIHLFFLHG